MKWRLAPLKQVHLPYLSQVSNSKIDFWIFGKVLLFHCLFLDKSWNGVNRYGELLSRLAQNYFKGILNIPVLILFFLQSSDFCYCCSFLKSIKLIFSSYLKMGGSRCIPISYSRLGQQKRMQVNTTNVSWKTAISSHIL